MARTHDVPVTLGPHHDDRAALRDVVAFADHVEPLPVHFRHAGRAERRQRHALGAEGRVLVTGIGATSSLSPMMPSISSERSEPEM